jgi:quercetin dioxygenase-like cupin family protein
MAEYSTFSPAEGERRVWRPIEGAKGWDAQPGPFILKVDRHNGGSSRLVFGTEDLPPGASIGRNRHLGADEIILLQNGRARVRLGDMTKEVHGGATVFIPANTWISVTNIGTDAISFVFVFSALGFVDFMRAESVREGEKITPLTKAGPKGKPAPYLAHQIAQRNTRFVSGFGDFC